MVNRGPARDQRPLGPGVAGVAARGVPAVTACAGEAGAQLSSSSFQYFVPWMVACSAKPFSVI